MKEKIIGIRQNPVIDQYRNDVEFRTQLILWLSLLMNLLYGGVNILSFILYRSYWFLILSVYYITLALMRFLLLRFFRRIGVGKDRRLEYRCSRLCGWILLTLNLTLSGAVLMILYQDKGYEFHGVLIYAVALFTFYIVAHTIVDLVKYRKYNSPVMTATKIISLTSALVSLLALETAMISRFGGEQSFAWRNQMIGSTGGGVILAVVAMSVYMIAQRSKE